MTPQIHAWRYKDDDQWEWRDLRDFVEDCQREIGFSPISDNLKARGIYAGFLKRYPDRAVEIARYAMVKCKGKWYGDPITMTRFSKGSDATFAEEILALIDRE